MSGNVPLAERPDSVPGGRLAAILPLRPVEAGRALALACGYALLGVVGLEGMLEPGWGVAFWPAAGLALAAAIVWGPKIWPGIFVGHMIAAAVAGADGAHLVDVAPSIGASLAAVLPAIAFRRQKLADNLSTLPAVLSLIVVGGFLGATLSLLLGLPVVLVSDWAVQNTSLAWWFGYLSGVLTVTPVILAWRPGAGPPLATPKLAHLGVSVSVTALTAYAILVWSPPQLMQAWYLFPALVWPALAFSVRGAALALLIVAIVAFGAAMAGLGPFAIPQGFGGQVLLTQQFVAVIAATILILASVADERRGRELLRRSEQRLREETEALEILNRTGAAIAAELELDAAVQTVVDAGVDLSGARMGAFFYNVSDEAGESYTLFALSGAPRSVFERMGQPRNTAIFSPTFSGEGVLRADDITADPRYGRNPPHQGMPEGHPPVRSYLAAPVRSRSGEVLGGLFFGHPDVGVFDDRAERLIRGLATHAAIAIDNARLFQAAQREINQRRRAEGHQRLLMNELNHRVKNTLATVQSMGAQSLRSGRSLDEAKEAFVSRIMALSQAHNLLTAESWESADLEDVVRMAVAAFDEPDRSRFSIAGPGVRLKAAHALGLAMALHELGSNATKYGALSSDGGSVAIAWTVGDGGEVTFVWQEAGGPPVEPPLRRGFGSRLIQEGLAREFAGDVEMDYRPGGLHCELRFVLTAPTFDHDPDLDDAAQPPTAGEGGPPNSDGTA
jgi:two-component sensor histidine kinase/integral membrane sensor domain MASE1